MMRVAKWACSLGACLCCGLFAGVAATLGDAAARHRSVARTLYLGQLLAVMLLAWLFFNLPAWLDSAHYVSYLPSFAGCSANATEISADNKKIIDWLVQHELGVNALSIPERLCYGTLSTHRVMFALAVFHGAFALFMMGASSADPEPAFRTDLQHQWWPVKLVFLGLLLLAAFFALDNDTMRIYSWIAFAGGLAFILIQMLLLIEFAHRVSRTLGAGYVRAAQTSRAGRCAMGGGLVAALLVAYAGATVLLVLAFLSALDLDASCTVTWIAPLITLVLGVVATAAGTFGFKSTGGGVLPAAIVVLYCNYLTWSALSPEALRGHGCVTKASSGVVTVAHLVGIHEISRDAQQIILLGTAFLALLYATLRTSQRYADTPDAPDDSSVASTTTTTTTEPPPLEAEPHYNYSAFHAVFMLAAMYAGMVLAGWNSVQSTTGAATIATTFVNYTSGAMWVKVLSAHATLIVYIWTVFAPLACRRCRQPLATPLPAPPNDHEAVPLDPGV